MKDQNALMALTQSDDRHSFRSPGLPLKAKHLQLQYTSLFVNWLTSWWILFIYILKCYLSLGENGCVEKGRRILHSGFRGEYRNDIKLPDKNTDHFEKQWQEKNGWKRSSAWSAWTRQKRRNISTHSTIPVSPSLFPLPPHWLPSIVPLSASLCFKSLDVI